jgi:beta-mannosidase
MWRAVEADDERRRVLPDPELDDTGWPEVAVPGQWRSSPDFAMSDGPVLYRHRFDTQPGPGRTWLTFDGMFYQADVWLDGSYLGDTEGYFAPHTFEVTDHLKDREDHLLAVELACDPETDPRHRHNLTGALQGGDGIDPAWNPGGIWAGVRLQRTGAVRLAALRVICREASDQRAALELEARLDATAGGPVELVTTVRRLGAQEPAAVTSSIPTMSEGDNRVKWRVTVERPDLWWPRALGAQPLYEVEVVVKVDGEPSDTRIGATGLRQVRMQRWVTTVNGERVFLKGANLGPSKRALADITAADVATDLGLACDAGLDLLRVRGHIATPELYDQADRLGMLLWQDLPLYGHYAGNRRQAAVQAQRAVNLLGHHPSIALWCGHNDPTETGEGDDTPLTGERITRRALRQALPDLPGLRLDRSVRRAIERADGSRPVVAHGGVLPHPIGGTDTRLYPGWLDGGLDISGLLARWPVLARFVGEFGAQAVPTSDGFLHPERWPELDWDRLEAVDGLDRALIDQWTPPADYPTYEGWRDATQAHQAEVIRRCVETFRRLKYRPTGGFCVASLADAQPAISASVLDYLRVPKAGYASLEAACAPVIVVADYPAASYRPGGTFTAAVHVVSDRRSPIPEVEADVTLNWPGGGRSWVYGGQVGADACTRIGKVSTSIPADCPPGTVRLELRLRWSDPDTGEARSVTNGYESLVVERAESRASTT